MSKKPQNIDDVEMGFFDHLEALRGHIIKSLIAVLVLGIGFFIAKDFLFKTIVFGPLRQDFVSYRFFCWLSQSLGMGDSLCFAPSFGDKPLQTTGVGDAFFLHLQAAFVMGIIVAFPYIFYQFWSFISPGLYPKERQATRGVIFVCSILFMIGVAFGYFVLTPFTVNFFFYYEIPFTENHPTASSLIESIFMMTLPMGLVFELPVVIYFLAKLGLITHRVMSSFRRQAIVIILLISAIITPSADMFTQALVGLPLYLLYELSIGVARRETLKLEKANAVR